MDVEMHLSDDRFALVMYKITAPAQHPSVSVSHWTLLIKKRQIL